MSQDFGAVLARGDRAGAPSLGRDKSDPARRPTVFSRLDVLRRDPHCLRTGKPLDGPAEWRR